jgi:2Fe-2S ferredoxin
MMVKITFMPDKKTVQVKPGTSLLHAARQAKVPMRTRCDGKASCLMCQVKISDPRTVSPLSEKERLKLGAKAAQNVRLACQARAQRDALVHLPEDPLKAVIRKKMAELKNQHDETF